VIMHGMRCRLEMRVLCLTLTTEGRRREHTVPVYASASLDLMPRRWSVSLFATNER